MKVVESTSTHAFKEGMKEMSKKFAEVGSEAQLANAGKIRI